jgi:hypothetical protein
MKLVGWRQSLVSLAVLLIWASPSCTHVAVVTGRTTSTGAGGAGGTPPFSNDGGSTGTLTPCPPSPPCCGGACQDFPAAPIVVDPTVPANAPSLFGAPGNYTAPTAATPLCVLEPQLGTATTEGAMMPSNWVEPRFRVNAMGLNLFEIRITSPVEENPLVVYTTQQEWYMPSAIWFGSPSGTGLGNNAAGVPLTVTIRGIDTATSGMTPVGVTGDLNIAPVVVTGTVVFLGVSSSQVMPVGGSQLIGFGVGVDGVQTALTLSQIAWAGQPGEDGAEPRGYLTPAAGFAEGQVQCMGCHVATPDGSAVVFTDNWSWMKGAASLPGAASPGAGVVPTQFSAAGSTKPATMAFGPGAQSMLKTPWWGAQTMSPAHWKPGDAILVSSYGTSFQGSPPAFTTGLERTTVWQALPYYDATDPLLDDRVNHHTLAWIDMESTATIDVAFPVPPDYGQSLTARQMQAAAAEGTAWGLIATGDMLSDVMPSLSNLAGTNTIAYVESDFTPDGHPDYTATQASIRTVPYNDHAGGTSQPLEGASDPNHLDYYPSYSPDDAFIAFVQAPAPSASSPDGPYYNRFGQVLIVPSAGGTPTVLAANDPNACAGDDLSQGIINSWPQWSPEAVVAANGKTYYFLVFSSARLYADEFGASFMLPQDPTSAFTGLHASSQLYLAAIVVDNTTKEITTYPAVYIWPQNRFSGAGNPPPHSNLTPVWGPFSFSVPPL